MNKEIFIAVCDRLKTEVPQLRWIDAEEGQLNTGERPAVAFPCCLIDISYPSCETHMGGRQKIKAQIQVRVAFQSGGSTNAAAPKLVREHALRCMDTLDKIHEALQWWNGGNLFNPMRRLRGAPEKRADGLKGDGSIGGGNRACSAAVTGFLYFRAKKRYHELLLHIHWIT